MINSIGGIGAGTMGERRKDAAIGGIGAGTMEERRNDAAIRAAAVGTIDSSLLPFTTCIAAIDLSISV